MDDEELFQKVMQLQGAKPAADASRPAKVAFMFLTLGTLPLAPLWSRFFLGQGREHEGKYSIYLHSYGRFSNDHLSLPFRGRRIPGKVFGWGHMEVVQAERRLIASALLDPLNERFVLLSDSCVPLFNLSFVYDYLMGSPYSFVKGMRVGTGEVPGTGHWNAEFLPLITIRQWTSGGAWWAVTRELAWPIVMDFTFYSAFARGCEFAKGCYPEEHYVQTMLHMFFGHKIVNRTLTWEDRSQGNIQPSSFSESDVLPRNVSQSLILRLGVEAQTTCAWKDGEESRCYLFARQFQPSSLNALLALSPRMGIPAEGRT